MLKQGDIFDLIGRAYRIISVLKKTNIRSKHNYIVRLLEGEKIPEAESTYTYHEYWVEMEPLTEDPLKMHRKRTIIWKESEFLNKVAS